MPSEPSVTAIQLSKITFEAHLDPEEQNLIISIYPSIVKGFFQPNPSTAEGGLYYTNLTLTCQPKKQPPQSAVRLKSPRIWRIICDGLSSISRK